MSVIAARTKRWSPVCHAVEDDGALCGARPRAGHWTLSSHVPINCPACLLELSAVRYAFCGIPSMPSMERTHIRLLGPDGLSRGGGRPHRTLCGRAAGWDTGMVVQLDQDDATVCAACRVLYRGQTQKAPLRVVR